MRETKGSQQSDLWLRNKVGRIGGTGLAACASYLTRASGKKVKGAPSAERDKFMMLLIAERLTGRTADKYVTPQMEWGIETEEEAARFYEILMEELVTPVNFVLHPRFDYAGCSPDRLVGNDGLLEIKCPATTTHIGYKLTGLLPEDYVPQVAWELACTGRKWADFLSYDPRVTDESFRFFYKRTTREELYWEGWDGTIYAGEDVITFFEAEAEKMEASIQAFIAEHSMKCIAPFPVEFKGDSPEETDEYDHSKNFAGQNFDFLDGAEVMP